MQQYAVDRRVLALRQLLDVLLADRLGIGAHGRVDIAARIVEGRDLRLDLPLLDRLLRLGAGLDRLWRRPALDLLLGRRFLLAGFHIDGGQRARRARRRLRLRLRGLRGRRRRRRLRGARPDEVKRHERRTAQKQHAKHTI